MKFKLNKLEFVIVIVWIGLATAMVLVDF